MTKLLEGKLIAERIKSELISQVAELKSRFGTNPKLVSVQVGDNVSSELYIRNQNKAAESLDIDYEAKRLNPSASERELEDVLNALNVDPSVTAIMLQLPTPNHIDVKRVIGLIAPEKDAEGMHPQNIGNIVFGKYSIGPCTAMAVMELLASTGVKLYGKEAVVIGHSEIVGKPLALMLLNNFATTTVCHIATSQRGSLAEHVQRAEVLIVAVGKAGLIKGDWVRSGAIIIDVGINKVNGKIVGDVESARASARASYMTPVPGGVGPLTTMMLMRNTIEQFKAQHHGKR